MIHASLNNTNIVGLKTHLFVHDQRENLP